jgi:DNA-binding transcriptional ArsR family regulator
MGRFRAYADGNHVQDQPRLRAARIGADRTGGRICKMRRASTKTFGGLNRRKIAMRTSQSTASARQSAVGAANVEKMADKAKNAADFLKALAHENRLMILCILSQGEKSVSELERQLALRQPTVSQQLARLRADGLVAARRDGKTIYYSVASPEARIIVGALYQVFCEKSKC